MLLLKGTFNDRGNVYSIHPDDIPGFVFPDDYQAVLRGIDFYVDSEEDDYYIDLNRDKLIM